MIAGMKPLDLAAGIAAMVVILLAWSWAMTWSREP